MVILESWLYHFIAIFIRMSNTHFLDVLNTLQHLVAELQKKWPSCENNKAMISKFFIVLLEGYKAMDSLKLLTVMY